MMIFKPTTLTEWTAYTIQNFVSDAFFWPLIGQESDNTCLVLVKATYSENTTVNRNYYSQGNIWSPTEDCFLFIIMLDICLTWKSTKTQATTFYILEITQMKLSRFK